MGKKSTAMIASIDAAVAVAQINAASYAKARKIFETFGDQQIELLEEQMAALHAVGGDIKKALSDKNYIKATKECENKEEEGEKLLKIMNGWVEKTNSSIADAERSLKQFESYLEVKEKTTKFPWNKKTLSSSKAFVKKAKSILLSIQLTEIVFYV